MAIAESRLSQKNIDSEYDLSGYCIGLSPIIFGEEGQYVQSDMQFALQIKDAIHEQHFSDEISDSILDPSIALVLSTRYFQNDYVD